MLLSAIPGDGIGQEVVPAALQVMEAVIPDLQTHQLQAGWTCFEDTGQSVAPETLSHLLTSGAGLFGAVSSPSRKVAGYRSAILHLRQELELYANIRPIKSLPGYGPDADVDLVIVRENSEGLYVGQERLDGDRAIAERVITHEASRRIARLALELARSRPRQRLTIVHKANVLPVSDGLFRDTVREVGADFPDVEIDEILVDIAALKLIEDPGRFDVVVTTNMFGDILSDLAAWWCGGMGLAPSLNLGDQCALAEPVHGSAPDIAGTGSANPIATILAAALLVRYAWNLPEAATRIEKAVRQAQPVQGTHAITQSILDHL